MKLKVEADCASATAYSVAARRSHAAGNWSVWPRSRTRSPELENLVRAGIDQALAGALDGHDAGAGLLAQGNFAQLAPDHRRAGRNLHRVEFRLVQQLRHRLGPSPGAAAAARSAFRAARSPRGCKCAPGSGRKRSAATVTMSSSGNMLSSEPRIDVLSSTVRNVMTTNETSTKTWPMTMRAAPPLLSARRDGHADFGDEHAHGLDFADAGQVNGRASAPSRRARPAPRAPRARGWPAADTCRPIARSTRRARRRPPSTKD